MPFYNDKDGEFSFKDRQSLCAAADRFAAQTPENIYKQSARLHYIARYMIAVHEADLGKLPLQVWNEYRSAFDHFMRYTTSGQTQDKNHIYKMEGHLQRAVLDASKLVCLNFFEKVETEFSEWGTDVIDIFDGGTLGRTIRQNLTEARDLFIEAKMSDNHLGDNPNHNNSVINKFLDCYFKLDQTLRIIDEHDSSVKTMKETFSQKKKSSDIRQNLYVSVPVSFVFMILAWLMGKFL